MIRDRTKSVAEEINGVHEGDAAFANYVWMAGYTLRMPGKRNTVEDLTQSDSGRLSRANASHPSIAGAPQEGSLQTASDTFKPFSLKTLDGKKKTLKDFSNKVTLVSFFFPRCPYCNVELPLIQKIYDKFKDRGLSAVWVNILPEEEGLIAGWQMAKNLTVPVLVGGSQVSLQRDYHIDSTPSTYLLDENGRVLFREDGYKPGDEKTLEAKIEVALDVVPAVTASASLPTCPVRPEDLQPSTPAPRIVDARPRE
jgi:cytochrome oxidase Cu insertion factor (SCO1/SenC/PrrC family)